MLSHDIKYTGGSAVLSALTASIAAEKEACQGQLLIVLPCVYQQSFAFISVYAPNEGQAREQLFSVEGGIAADPSRQLNYGGRLEWKFKIGIL